jgi:hypothetical protein
MAYRGDRSGTGPVAQALEAAARRVQAALGHAAPPLQVALEPWDAMYWSFRYVQVVKPGSPMAR